MKPLIKTFILLSLTPGFTGGQTMDQTLQKLITIGLIEQKHTHDFDELLEREGSTSRTAYLHLLLQVEVEKLTGEAEAWFSIQVLSTDRPDPTSQAKINEELTQYLSKLHYCNLIDADQQDRFRARIANSDFVNSVQLLTTLSEEVSLKEYMSPERLTLFAKTLREHGIVSAHYDRLIAEINKGRLQAPIDFLHSCNNAVVINKNDYQNEPEKYLDLIHQKTASVIPELRFTDFEFKVVLNRSLSGNNYQFYDLVVSIKSNGRTYKQRSFHHLESPGKQQSSGGGIDQQTYYNIFNKILTDLQSPYRLHEIKSYQGIAVDWNTFGIIALTEEQADVLHRRDAYISPSYENFDNTLTSTRIAEAIDRYIEIGLLSHLTSRQIEEAKERVAEQENTNLNDVLTAFPDTIHEFDTELGNLEDPYAELIRECERISHGDFDATEITDDFAAQRETATLTFKIGNRIYSGEFAIHDDWLDRRFLSFIASVAADEKLKGQFYELDSQGQDARIIYLTRKQYDYLRTNRLLVFTE